MAPLLPLAMSKTALAVISIAVLSAVGLLAWLMRTETREEAAELARERERAERER